MGQVSGRQERSKKPEVALSETMEAEIEVQNNEEEIEEVKAKSPKLTSVFGVADLKNGNNILPILHCYIFCFLCLLVLFSVYRLNFLLFLTSSLSNIQMILILPCQVAISSFFLEWNSLRSQSFFLV